MLVINIVMIIATGVTNHRLNLQLSKLILWWVPCILLVVWSLPWIEAALFAGGLGKHLRRQKRKTYISFSSQSLSASIPTCDGGFLVDAQSGSLACNPLWYPTGALQGCHGKKSGRC